MSYFLFFSEAQTLIFCALHLRCIISISLHLKEMKGVLLRFRYITANNPRHVNIIFISTRLFSPDSQIFKLAAQIYCIDQRRFLQSKSMSFSRIKRVTISEDKISLESFI